MGGWPYAPYASKHETDANYKKMLREVMQPGNAEYIRIGVASHNLFDIALAMLWAGETAMFPAVQFEMLEGMANHQRRAIFEATRSVLLYAPACRRDEFLNAIGYLVRRMDENTGEENFLRHAFQLEAETPVWEQLAAGFRKALDGMHTVSTEPRKDQDRRQSPTQPPVAAHWSSYVGEPDTDWGVPTNAEWAQAVVAEWQGRAGDAATEIPLVVAGDEVKLERAGRESFDPSRPGMVSCRFSEANADDIDRALACAESDPSGWRKMSDQRRHELLRATAQLMRERRGDLIGAAMLDGGKTFAEADPEVSEAIDFVEFYPLTVQAMRDRKSIHSAPRGIVVVVSPMELPAGDSLRWRGGGVGGRQYRHSEAGQRYGLACVGDCKVFLGCGSAPGGVAGRAVFRFAGRSSPDSGQTGSHRDSYRRNRNRSQHVGGPSVAASGRRNGREECPRSYRRFRIVIWRSSTCCIRRLGTVVKNVVRLPCCCWRMKSMKTGASVKRWPMRCAA